jgi:hypothetical protein
MSVANQPASANQSNDEQTNEGVRAPNGQVWHSLCNPHPSSVSLASRGRGRTLHVSWAADILTLPSVSI